MRKILALVVLLALAAPAVAADNTLLVTPCAAGCITTRSKDVGAGVQAPMPIMSDASGTAIYGTAGTANANVLTVQGIAAMTPFIVTNSGTFAVQAAQSGTWNITNVSGTVSLPTGASTSANQTSELTKLDSIISNTAAAIPAGTNVIGFVSNDPCSQATKLGAPINLTVSGQVITGTSAKKTYICAIDLMVTTAGSAALVEGTGSVCATNIFGLAGGTTAGTGWPVPATGGLTKGAGSGTIISPSADTNATAANVCLLLSGTGQTSGHISYVQQ